jgi:hypothetical protein
MLDRIITTKMSARIIARLLKEGWTVERVARTIDAPESFVRGVQAKQHVLTFKDIEAIADHTPETAPLMILNSIPPADINPEVKALFDTLRVQLETSASVDKEFRTKTTRKRRTRTRAA